MITWLLLFFESIIDSPKRYVVLRKWDVLIGITEMWKLIKDSDNTNECKFARSRKDSVTSTPLINMIS